MYLNSDIFIPFNGLRCILSYSTAPEKYTFVFLQLFTPVFSFDKKSNRFFFFQPLPLYIWHLIGNTFQLLTKNLCCKIEEEKIGKSDKAENSTTLKLLIPLIQFHWIFHQRMVSHASVKLRNACPIVTSRDYFWFCFKK